MQKRSKHGVNPKDNEKTRWKLDKKYSRKTNVEKIATSSKREQN